MLLSLIDPILLLQSSEPTNILWRRPVKLISLFVFAIGPILALYSPKSIYILWHTTRSPLSPELDKFGSFSLDTRPLGSSIPVGNVNLRRSLSVYCGNAHSLTR